MSALDRDHLLCARLKRHPHLRARVESRLEVVEDAAGACEKADAAERRVIEELRQLGHDVLMAWAEHSVETHTARAQREPDWRPGGKKTSIGTPPSGESRGSTRSGGTVRALSGHSVPWRGSGAGVARCRCSG